MDRDRIVCRRAITGRESRGRDGDRLVRSDGGWRNVNVGRVARGVDRIPRAQGPGARGAQGPRDCPAVRPVGIHQGGERSRLALRQTVRGSRQRDTRVPGSAVGWRSLAPQRSRCQRPQQRTPKPPANPIPVHASTRYFNMLRRLPRVPATTSAAVPSRYATHKATRTGSVTTPLLKTVRRRRASPNPTA